MPSGSRNSNYNHQRYWDPDPEMDVLDVPSLGEVSRRTLMDLPTHMLTAHELRIRDQIQLDELVALNEMAKATQQYGISASQATLALRKLGTTTEKPAYLTQQMHPAGGGGAGGTSTISAYSNIDPIMKEVARRVIAGDVPPGPTTFGLEQLGIVDQKTQTVITAPEEPPKPQRKDIKPALKLAGLRIVGWGIFVLCVTGIIASIFGVK